MTDLFKYPSIRHFVALTDVRDDKVLTDKERYNFLDKSLVLEEKLDGANLGFSVEDGVVRVQNRGKWIDLSRPEPQFKKLNNWIEQANLKKKLYEKFILFGEWMYAKHSILYTELNDWFYAYDIYNRESGKWASREVLSLICGSLSIYTAPHFMSGIFETDQLIDYTKIRSSLYDGPLEGIVIRVENENECLDKAKIVREDFTQAIEEHWSSKTLIPNRRVS